LTTVFALLFWDIIFAAIPGAFETQYQYAPLDMSEDTFYYARKDLTAQRLTEIEEGGAKLILETHDALYREKKTWGVGVRWDVCDSRDLMEIAEVSIIKR
jgi:Fanconi-associated nuclease 1